MIFPVSRLQFSPSLIILYSHFYTCSNSSLLQHLCTQVSTSWTFWRAPSPLLAAFDPLGTRIAISFDSPTNRDGMTDRNCSRFLQASSVCRLGKNPFCFWSNDLTLQVMLGPQADLIPGDLLGLLGGRIRSTGGYSSPMAAKSVQVGLPTRPRLPVVQVSGPASVDTCGTLALRASGVSARPLRFKWSCSNDKALDVYLRDLPPSDGMLELGPGTPQMQQVDKTYRVEVEAIDFMGFQSFAVGLNILKKSLAAPSFVFSSPQVTKCAISQDQWHLNRHWWKLQRLSHSKFWYISFGPRYII